MGERQQNEEKKDQEEEKVKSRDHPIVKPSNLANAGNGVFTTRTYKKGELVCFFDGIPKEIESLSDFEYSMLRAPNKTESYILVGVYPTPRSPLGIGQFINDGSMLLIPTEGSTTEHLQAICDIYEKESQQKVNVSFSRSGKQGLNLFATRDLEVDEELYLSYSPYYWFFLHEFEKKNFPRILELYKCNSEFHYFNDEKRLVCFREKEITATELFAIWPKIEPDDPLFTRLGIQDLDDFDRLKHLVSLLWLPHPAERTWRFCLAIVKGPDRWTTEEVESPWYTSFEECFLAFLHRRRSDAEKGVIHDKFMHHLDYRNEEGKIIVNHFIGSTVIVSSYTCPKELGITMDRLNQFMESLDFMLE